MQFQGSLFCSKYTSFIRNRSQQIDLTSQRAISHLSRQVFNLAPQYRQQAVKQTIIIANSPSKTN
ncbi:unnamed protein product [Paramecium sonneborni]|uniref:Uncharacterized protein n=1 Tax=Paramecium sonneborni TaxID=65129 RepID=A0A8S1Q593_9CILI|nr:unnamed protein product [Paramecium sonneborni]